MHAQGKRGKSEWSAPNLFSVSEVPSAVDVHEALDVLEGHTDTINAAAISFDGNYICTTSDDMTARIWERRRPEQWWGVFHLKEFWLTLALTLALLWSVRRDWKRLPSTQAGAG